MIRLTPGQAQKLGVIKTKKPHKPVFTKAEWETISLSGCVKLTIPENMPPLNVWKKWSSWKYAKYLKYLTEQVMKLYNKAKPTTLERSRILIIHYHRVKRNRDDDGYAPKFLMDALKYAGFIQDDNHDVCEQMRPEFKKDATHWRTEIYIYPKGDE